MVRASAERAADAPGLSVRYPASEARKLWACSPFRPTRNSKSLIVSDVVNAE